MLKVSIIIPIYNAKCYIERCVDSVLAQTFTDWEMILVNDGSKDYSLSICQMYAQNDSRIRVIDKPNGGPSSARNRGLEGAKGEYVYFMDADDWIEDSFLDAFFIKEDENETLRYENEDGKVNNLYDIVFQGFVREFPDGRKEKSFAMNSDTSTMPKEDIICKLYKEHVYGWAWCKVFRKEIIDRYHLRFDESLRLWEDELFTTDFLKFAKTIRTIDSHLYHYIYYSNSLMQTNNTYLKRLFLSERMNEALMPIANEELKEYLRKTYNKNLKYSMLMALKNERNHLCDNATKETLLDRYYVRCKDYPELKELNVLRNRLSYYIAEGILQTRWKKFVIFLMSKV